MIWVGAGKPVWLVVHPYNRPVWSEASVVYQLCCGGYAGPMWESWLKLVVYCMLGKSPVYVIQLPVSASLVVVLWVIRSSFMDYLLVQLMYPPFQSHFTCAYNRRYQCSRCPGLYWIHVHNDEWCTLSDFIPSVIAHKMMKGSLSVSVTWYSFEFLVDDLYILGQLLWFVWSTPTWWDVQNI